MRIIGILSSATLIFSACGDDGGTNPASDANPQVPTIDASPIDAGSVTIYAGCANDAVGELIDVVITELRRLKDERLPESELRRAKDHLKGSLMLNLESTSSRMSHLARQEIYFDRQVGLDETLRGVEQVSADDVQRVARDLFANGALSATVLGAVNGLQLPPERLSLG